MSELLIIAGLLLLNGFFALAELSIVSSRRARLESMAARRVRGARTALALAGEPDRFLSSVQIGITLVGIVSGAFGAAAFGDDLAGLIARIGPLSAYSWQIANALIVTGLTYLSVVLGELVPKQLALGSPERFACLVAPVMSFIALLFRPFVWLLSRSSSFIVLLLGRRPNEVPEVTEEEVSIVMGEATRSGAIDQREKDIAIRALRFADRPVSTIMTARNEVVYIREGDSLEELLEKMVASGHSHYPLCGRNVDDVLGSLAQHDLVQHQLKKGFSANPEERARQLRAIARPPIIIPEGASGIHALETMRRLKGHFAIITDEFGGMAGVLSNHDLLEALVGFVPGSEGDEDPLVRRADGSLLVSGWVPMGDVLIALNRDRNPGIESTSIAGFLLQRLHGIPAVGAIHDEDGMRFEVIDKDGNRIDRVLVTPLPQEPSSAD